MYFLLLKLLRKLTGLFSSLHGIELAFSKKKFNLWMFLLSVKPSFQQTFGACKLTLVINCDA